jgi:hypothetical protein
MPFDMLLDAVGELQRIRDRGQHLLAGAARGVEGAAGEQACQVLVERAHRRRDRHVVVVEDDQQVGVGHAGVVERLEGHAGGHGAVADDGDDVLLLALVRVRHGHAQRGRDRGRRVAVPKVSYGLSSRRGKPETPPKHAQPGHAGRRPVSTLWRVGLVADVPDHAVVRRVEDVVQGDGQFHRAEVGGQMAAGLRHRLDEEGAQFLARVPQFACDRVLAQVGGGADAFQVRIGGQGGPAFGLFLGDVVGRNQKARCTM